MPCAKRPQVLAGAFNVARAGLGRDAQQPIRGAAQRRHDDNRPAPVRAFRLNRACRAARTIAINRSMAARSATDVPPNFITIICVSPS
jgi:hypothetical protein